MTQGQPAAGSMESLYPFLYSGTTDLAAVLEQVRRSTVAKAGEITELRRVISARDGARLMACAAPSARGTGPGSPSARRRPRPGSARAGGCSPSATAAAPPTPSSWPRCS